MSSNETLAGFTNRDITIFDPSTAISTAITVASRKKIRHLPVVEGETIIGMVTFRDLISYLLPKISLMTVKKYQ
jgi:CBS domain-containing protein